MRSCEEIRKMMNEYLDNELDSKLLSGFSEHIKNCSSCKYELEETRQVLSLLKVLPEVELPFNFKDKLHSKLIEEKINYDNKNNSILLRSKYIKIISTVAAILIFVIISKGIFLKHVYQTASDNSVNAPQAALAPSVGDGAIQKPTISGNAKSSINGSSYEAESASQTNQDTAGKNADTKSSTKKSEIGIDSKKSETDVDSKKADADVATKKADTDVASKKVEASKKIEATKKVDTTNKTVQDLTGKNAPDVVIKKDEVNLFNEAVSPNNEKIISNKDISLKVENPDKDIETIKSDLVENGAKLLTDFDLQLSSQFDSKSASIIDYNKMEIKFIISSAVYSKVLDALYSAWGKDAFTIKEAAPIKENDEIKQLNSKVTELDTQINSFEKGKDDEKINELESQKSELQAELDVLNKDMDYTIVSLAISSK